MLVLLNVGPLITEMDVWFVCLFVHLFIHSEI